MTAQYTAILYGLERMVDNCVSIAEEAMDGVRFVTLEPDVAKELAVENTQLPE